MTDPTKRRNRFEVRAILYGGVSGTLIAAFATIDDAEAAFHGDGHLIVLGPNPEDAGSSTLIYSRQVAGRWIRDVV